MKLKNATTMCSSRRTSAVMKTSLTATWPMMKKCAFTGQTAGKWTSSNKTTWLAATTPTQTISVRK